MNKINSKENKNCITKTNVKHFPKLAQRGRFLRRDLKEARGLLCHSSAGREFCSLGAPSPLVTNCDLGLTCRAPPTDLSRLEGTYQVSKLKIYLGARPFNALNISNKILKSIGFVSPDSCQYTDLLYLLANVERYTSLRFNKGFIGIWIPYWI